MRYKIGDKVIPINKTAGATNCRYRNAFKRGDVKFLYVVKIEHGKYVLNIRNDSDGGNYYEEEDILPYQMSDEELFKMLIKGVITDDEYEELTS